MSSPPIEKPVENSPGSRSANPLRLAIVTRRFWPYSGTTEMAIGDLASEIKLAGHSVEILTVRWEKIWPTYFQFQELTVHRINRPASSPWGSFRYLRSLTRELVELKLDGIIVYGLGEEAWAISKSFGGRIPFVIRIDNHLLGSHKRPPNFTARQLSALNSATSVLVESQWTRDRITNHPSVKNPAISVVPDGIRIDPEQTRTPAEYGASRVAISDAHPVLMIGPTQPLVVCGSPLHGDRGLIDLVNAWPRVLERFPKSRLWIVGDGKKGRQVWEHLQEKNLVHSVIMPGSFDDLHDILQAADVCVHPLRSDESCGFLARALVGGVCCVVTSTHSTRTVVENNVNGLVVGINEPRALADAIILALSNNELRDRLGRAALKSAVTAYDIKRLVNCFLDPILESVSQPSDPQTIEQAANSSSPL
jgi:glycosyltransferase involved in cell wall biosynthesis